MFINQIKCGCGCEYYPQGYNGCPQCGRGKVKVVTTTSTNWINEPIRINGNGERF